MMFKFIIRKQMSFLLIILIAVASIFLISHDTKKVNNAMAEEELIVERVDYLLHSKGLWLMQVRFSLPFSDTEKADVIDNNYLNNFIIINGKTIADIRQAKDENGELLEHAIFTHVLGNGNDPYIVIHIALSDKVKAEDGGIVEGEINEIVIKSGFKNSSLAEVKQDTKFLHKGAGWVKQIDTSHVVWDEIQVTGISAPSKSLYSNVSFTVTFNKNLSNKALLHINADSTWLLGVSAQNPAPFVYSAEEIQLLDMYGIKSSFSELIYFNGVSLAELMKKESDLAYRPATVMVHVGGNGNMNELEIVFGGERTQDGQVVDGANKLDDLNKEFIFEFKKGFKTSTVLEIKEDVTFKYNYHSKRFIKNNTSADLTNSKISGIFYNGEEVISGATIKAKGAEFDENLLTVLCEDLAASYSYESKKISKNQHEIIITVTAADGVTKDSYSFNLKFDSEGCGSELSVAFIPIILLFFIMPLAIKRRVQK